MHWHYGLDFFSISHAILDFNNIKYCHFFYNFSMNPHTILIFIPKIKRTKRNCGQFAKTKVKKIVIVSFPTFGHYN
jgi:hypothetical protein